MKIDLVSMPADLRPHHLAGRCVVIFDVLRATTTMAAALRNGATEVRIFDDIEPARRAAGAFAGGKLLAGERLGVLIDGFDLGNSPGEMTNDRVMGRTLFMTTTNGTRAIVAARGVGGVGGVGGALVRIVAGFVNLSISANYVRALGLDVTLLSAGTEGQPTGEDDAAALAMAAMLRGEPAPQRVDPGRIALFSETLGGKNVIRLKQEEDLHFAATVDCCEVVCIVGDDDVVRRANPDHGASCEIIAGVV